MNVWDVEPGLKKGDAVKITDNSGSFMGVVAHSSGEFEMAIKLEGQKALFRCMTVGDVRVRKVK
jgi:hypothetical protein